ncbi:nucleotide disphospho-sugar-binding domain-containing protein [Ideonella sp. DXS22W]|uniref:Nucleotide disphospho-sugar-binding domain-containing protein n=1 Tax=Pseudaquabacterium inlustre TaxID=2984192 RepID=A0ABU9CQC9_9BURK
MKILLCAVGSHGDVLPAVALGQALQRRGHAPQLFANAAFEPLARAAGLPFTATGRAADMADALSNPDATDARKGLALLAQGVLRSATQGYPLLCQAHEAGRTLVVGTSLAWSARLLSETHGTPGAVLHLAPSWLRSAHRAPSLGPLGHLAGAPRWLKRWAFGLMDRRLLDPLFTTPFNALRARLGLAPVQRCFDAWMHQADCVLGLFPDWFAPRQPDWPVALQLTGFPLDTPEADVPLPDDAAAFLAAGSAPVLVTGGTANASSHALFASAIEACRLNRQRALLLTQDARQLPDTLPAGMAHFRYLPLRRLLPRVATVVHHGGIGTTAQALQAGVPQLIRPMGFDQFDNAGRAQALGVARTLPTGRHAPAALARLLRMPDRDPTWRTRCAELARQAAASQGVAAACDAILQMRRAAALTAPRSPADQ